MVLGVPLLEDTVHVFIYKLNGNQILSEFCIYSFYRVNGNQNR